MKRAIVFTAITALILCVGCASQRSDKSGSQMEEALMAAIENRKFTVTVTQALPLHGKTVNLASLYYLTVDGDRVVSRLPFFGRGYSIPYGGGEGLMFEGETTDYRTEEGRRGAKDITFNVRTDEDRYSFRLNIFPNGSTSIHVTPINRSSISFNGSARPGDRESVR